jgi:hypothetical protein
MSSLKSSVGVREVWKRLQGCDIHEVVVNGPALDESALSVGNKSVHERLQSKGHQFSNYLCHNMDEADGTEIADRVASLLLGTRTIFAVFRMSKKLCL